MSSFRRRLMIVKPSLLPGGIPIDNAPNGVYIYADGKLFKQNEWNTLWNDYAIGIAIISNTHRYNGFLISLDEVNNLNWYPNADINPPEIVSQILITTNRRVAKQDYRGIQNTNILVNKYGKNNNYAAGYCLNYIFKDGKVGYLGSCGDWIELTTTLEEVNSCLSLVGGSKIQKTIYWASTQTDKDSSWCFRGSDKEIYSSVKRSKYRVRAFTTLK